MEFIELRAQAIATGLETGLPSLFPQWRVNMKNQNSCKTLQTGSNSSDPKAHKEKQTQHQAQDKSVLFSYMFRKERTILFLKGEFL